MSEDTGIMWLMATRNHLRLLLQEVMAASGHAAPSITLKGGPVRLRIGCASASTLANLRAALAPTFTTTDSTTGPALQEVRVALDSGLAHRLEHVTGGNSLDDGATEPHEVRADVHLVRKHTGGPSGRRSAYLLWSAADPRTSYIVLSGSGMTSDTLLMRLVRGIAARVLLAEGWTPLHAACVMTRAGAVCLLGERGSGKTTALLHLLAGAAGPVALVANSIVFLRPQGAVEVCTLPTAIGLRAPSMGLFPTLNTLARDSGAVLGTEGKVYLPAFLLAEAFGVPRSAGGRLAAFISVAYRGGQQSTWRMLTSEQREAALLNAYLPDGLVDDPHEHARLATEHTRSHHRRLRRYARLTAAAMLEPGIDTAPVLGGGLIDLLAQATR